MRPLRRHKSDLTKKDIIFMWGPEHHKAFDNVKKPSLTYFDTNKPVTIQTDARKRGVGATILQHGRPVAYASKSLTETESYCNIEREMLSIVFGRSHHYGHGRHVTIETDHKPLESIASNECSSEIDENATWYTEIRLHLEICPRKGHSLSIADGLSRLPVHGGVISDLNVTIHETTGVPDSKLEKIIDMNDKMR